MIAKVFLFLAICWLTVVSGDGEGDAWWRSANFYQISPVSFVDSNNDGFGDILGVISKLEFLKETGVDVIFLTPFYRTGFKDFGYDVASYVDVDERFGKMEDVEELFRKAKELGLKVVIDFVPNHTSNQHDWFVRSENDEKEFKNFYIWHDGLPTINNGKPLMPNKWQSTYGGSVWKWSDKREAYYFHEFAQEQPDLNLREPRVLTELDNVLTFWLEKGADGFRIDAVSQLYEDPSFMEVPDIINNLPQTYELVQRWRNLLDAYTQTHGGDKRILVPQVWNSTTADLMRYYEEEGQQLTEIPTNFMLINNLQNNSTAADYKKVIDNYLKALPNGAIANWFLGTHDHSRVASRMGIERLEGLTLLLLTLPGIAFTYNGDEIGMENHHEISWDDTNDPWACNANPNNYDKLSRDPQRTPYQWDGSTNGGFNTGSEPWIEIHPNFTSNNLKVQIEAEKSHFNFYKNLLWLRKNETFAKGDFKSIVLAENVFGYYRSFNGEYYAVLINFGGKAEKVKLKELTDKFEDEQEVVLAASTSAFGVGTILNANEIKLNAFDAVILKARSAASTTTLSLLAIVMLLVKLFL